MQHLEKTAKNTWVLSVLVLAWLLAACETTDRPDEPICGNWFLETGEVCDSTNLQGKTCQAFGYGPGRLTCLDDCSGFDLSECGVPDSCDGSALDPNEVCDGSHLGGMTCEALGFGPGMLACLGNCSNFDTSLCGPMPSCGNGLREGKEACDGDDLGDANCQALGYAGGQLACAADCTLETGDCVPLDSCGDGVWSEGELCEGNDLHGATCVNQGFGDAGELACTGDCTFATSGCTDCGDGQAEGQEVCDSLDLSGQTCASLGFGPGNLRCRPDCGGFDTSLCESSPGCGNGVLEEGEVCDGQDLGGTRCEDLGNQTGVLGCQPDCMAFDTTACECVPASCEELSAQCGTVEDGCGTTLECGVCSDWLTCGGAGVPNQCGAECLQPCPEGSICSEQGVCVNADPTGLTLNVPTVHVSGSIYTNGLPAVETEDCSGADDDAAYVRFYEINHHYRVDHTIYCGEGLSFGPLPLFPGIYQVSVKGDDAGDTNVPAEFYVAEDELIIDANSTGLIFDVPTVQVSGSIYTNGVPAIETEDCTGADDDAAYLRFYEINHGYTVDHVIYCGQNLSFGPLVIFPGIYRVSVKGDDAGDTNVPAEFYVAEEDLVIAVNTTGLLLNVPTVQVSGSIQVNGQPALETEGCAGADDDAAYLRFYEINHGYTVDHTVYCGENLSFGPLVIFPGTYRVSVKGDDAGDTNVPAEFYVAEEQLVVAGNTTGLVLNVPTVQVSGSIQVNGQPALETEGCAGADDDAVYVRFYEINHGYTLDHTIYCGENLSFGPLVIFPGTYRVSVKGDDAGDTNVPPEYYVAEIELIIDTTTVGLVLNVPTVNLSGSIQVNGQPAVELEGCDGADDDAAYLRFYEVNHGYTVDHTIYCGENLSFGPLVIFPGTYRVSAKGDDAGDTDIPAEFYVAKEQLVVSANTTGLILNVPTISISGSIQVNGLPAVESEGCAGTDDDAAYLRFYEINHGYILNHTIYCGEGLSFGPLVIFPGIYQISVKGDDAGDTNIPAEYYVVFSRIELL